MTMKTNKFFAMAAVLTLSCGVALAGDTGQLTFDAGSQTVPDANPLGLTLSTNLGGISGNISSLTVSLDISGGYNGDLYAYLSGPDGGFAVLLNRVGESGSSAFGYDDTGFEVTFDDSAANGDIHLYQEAAGYSLNGSGQLTGTWAPDGEDIDPASSPSSFTGGGGADLSSFDGSGADGTWTLFLADLSGGGQSTVVSWGLDITTVPEPSALALLGLGAAALLIRRRSRMV